MRILFLDQYGDLGGAQRCLLDLLPEVRARGWTPSVAAPPGALLDQARRFGQVETLRLPAMRSARKAIGDWLRLATHTPPVAASIEQIASSHQAAVIHVNGPRLLLPMLLARPPVPCIFHSHHHIEQASARWSLKKARWCFLTPFACCPRTA
jgi:hypothetical protein